ncbi:PASTA domain-containing protein [Ruminococcaceae bacterium OttesenSCG-928-L11]|nr:PASTA domain-containing protein [Ruminococcaceae bacterium OttesenSCG-928-L11]
MLLVLIVLFMLSFFILIYRLFQLQIINGEEYRAKAFQQQTRSQTIGAKRGTIYDTNGNVLAQSGTVWNVCISPAQLDSEKLDATATALAEILEVDKAKILEAAADRGSYYKRIKRRVERAVMDAVNDYTLQNKVEGVFFEEDTKRYYTYGSLASTLLGFTNYDNQGAYGLEAKYDKVLSGTPGMVVSAKNAWGSDMPFKYSEKYAAQDGNSIVLTIDESIQHFLERHLETAIVEHYVGNKAAGIVMDVKTGAIVAMATKPDFDPNDPYTLADPAAVEELAQYTEGSDEYNEKKTQLQYAQWRNKAISDPYEPGSVFKIITASAALDNHRVSLNDHFYCTGSLQVSDRTIHCWKREGHGDQDFTKAMQNSCNPAFITIGQRTSATTLYEYMKNYGLMDPTGVDLPGEATGIHQSLETLNKEGMVELASTSFGQTFKITPLQLITAVSSAVNGGKLMQPYILKQVLDPAGNVLETTQPIVKRQVISEETSATMRQLVEAVVADGSGRNAAIPGYRIGGKTGTSQKLDIVEDLNILSFVGFVPMEDPRYAILVMLDEPELDNAFGSTIAAPVVGAVMNDMLQYLGIEPSFTEAELAEKKVEVPDVTGMKPHDAQAKMTLLGLQTRIVGSGASVIRQIPQAWQTMDKGGTVIFYTEEETLKTGIEIPSVVGMTAQEANKVLVELGLNISLRGVTQDGVQTIVSEQWPLAGETATTGDVIVVTLIRKPEEAGG